MIQKGFAAILLLSSVVPVLAQDDVLARGGRDGTMEYWWVDKIRGGPNAYKAPNRPIWRLSELADWLRKNNRSTFLMTAPPLRLPGAVGSPATPVATV